MERNLYSIGEKIKELRLSKGITQKELAGEFISRNMLSMIESGRALPSLETLIHISQILSVSPGYFFADDDELLQYSKRESVPEVYSHLSNCEYEDALILCEPFEDDREMKIYAVISYINIAKKYFDSAMLSTAMMYLKAALDSGYDMPFGGTDLCEIYDYCNTLTECVSRNEIPDELSSHSVMGSSYMPTSFAAYISALRALQNSDPDTASAIAKSGLLENFHSLHIRGAVSLLEEDYTTAARLMDLALSSGGGGFFSKYKLLYDLEVCRKKMGDFETAYSVQALRMDMVGMFSE